VKLIHAMILNQEAAAKYAARVVAAMIKSGCDPETMRRHGIPNSVFCCVLGGSHHRTQREPMEMAGDMIRYYCHRCLYADRA
jgi:hypothetical protein